MKMDRLKERKREGSLPGVRIRVWPSAKGLPSLSDSPSWEPGSLLPQLSEWQGQGTDARPGHPGVIGKALFTRGSGQIHSELDLLNVKHLSGCQLPTSQGVDSARRRIFLWLFQGCSLSGPCNHRVSFEEKWPLQSSGYTWKLESL